MRLWVSTQTRRGKVIMSGPRSRLCPWWSDSFPISEAWFHMASFLHNGPGRPRVCAGTPLRLIPLNQTRPTDWTEEPRRSSAFTRTRMHTPHPELPPLCFSCRTTKAPFVLIENGCFRSNGIAHQSKSCPVSSAEEGVASCFAFRNVTWPVDSWEGSAKKAGVPPRPSGEAAWLHSLLFLLPLWGLFSMNSTMRGNRSWTQLHIFTICHGVLVKCQEKHLFFFSFSSF